MSESPNVLPNGIVPPARKKETRVVTVRMTPELHDALKEEAWRRKTSVNLLAITKLRLTGAALSTALEDVGLDIPKK